LNKLNASINIPAREINLDGQTIKLKTHQWDRVKKVSQRQPRVCKTDPRPRENKYEKVEDTTESNEGSQRPVTERVGETPTKPSRAESLAEDEQVERLQQWQTVLPQTIQLEPRTLLVMRAKIMDARRRSSPKAITKGWIQTEPIEMPFRGIYAARTVSNVFASSELIDIEKRMIRVRNPKLADNSITKQSAKETVYCTTQLVNTSLERITLQAGTKIADIYDITQEDLIDGVTEDDVSYGPRVLKADRYPKQLDPKVREQNAHVPKLLEEKLNHLTEEEKRIVRPALLDYQDLFKKTEDGIIPCTDLGYHDKGDARPVKRNPYRIPYALRDELRGQIEEMVNKGVLTKTATEWAAPVILIRKKSTDGTIKYRFCADFRGLNAVTKIPVFSMPLVQENLDRLNGNQYFSFVDLKDAYYHIKIKPEDKHKTGITTPFGTYQYERLAFGLAGSPYTFTRVMDKVLLGLGSITCLVFMDDVLVFGRLLQEHTDRLREIFGRLRTAKLTLNLEKCHFTKDSVEYLGHCVTREGVKPSEDKVRAIREYPRPRTVTEVRSFLGLSGCYRQYIPNYAEISRPLSVLTKKDHDFQWDRDQEVAFNRLKTEISSDTVLACPSMDPTHEFRLHTDANDHGISAVLAKVQEGKERPVSYASRQLIPAEEKLSVTKEELLAVVYGTKQFRCYLYGRKFTLVTDHRALCWLLKLRDPSAKLTRWALRLSEFEYTVLHRPGRYHCVPDGLSCHIATLTLEGQVTRPEVKAEQEIDKFCRKVKEELGQ
jgi:hypothetical protein